MATTAAIDAIRAPSGGVNHRVAGILFAASDLLLYSFLLTGWRSCLLIGFAASPVLWRRIAPDRRHLAILFACLFSVGSTVLQPIENWALVLQSHWHLVFVSPGFAFRPTALVVVFLALSSRSRRVISACGANVVVAVLLFIALQWLGHLRADAETVGYVCLGFFVCAEAINLYALSFVVPEASTPAEHAICAVALCLTFVGATPIRLPFNGAEIGIWWPRTPAAEFAAVGEGHGWQNIGLYGELPRVLESSGRTVVRVETVDRLPSVDVLVLPPLLQPLSAGEISGIRAYVLAGGKLLLIGEHSDLGGVMESANGILSGTGVQLRFDTTNALFGDGNYAFSGEAARFPYLVHNRGASLSLSSPRARPLLVGSWWHADAGDPLAPERAYLSDYRLSPGDIVGHLVLGAETRLGRGRIIVWGDGSPFLNQNLMYNAEFIRSTVAELAGSSIQWVGAAVAALWLVLWAAVPTSWRAVPLLCLLVSTGPPHVGAAPASIRSAIISDSESNTFDRDPFADFGLTGLGVVLTRAGWLPRLGDWHEAASASLVFIVNPHYFPSSGLSRAVRERAAGGTTVVVTGDGNNDTFKEVAQSFDCAVDDFPVGSIKGEAATTYSAWPMSCSGGEPILVGATQVGAIVREGGGRVVMVADSGFLSSKNLEAESTFDQGNESLLLSLLQR